MWQTTRRDHHDIRAQGLNIFSLGIEIIGDLCAHPLQLGQTPINNPHQITAARISDQQVHLPARPIRGLQHLHLMPALGRNPCGFQARRASPDNYNLFRHVGFRNIMRDMSLPPRGRIMNTQRLAALVNPVQTIGRANTGTNAVLLPQGDLARDMRLGNMGARHPNHIQLSAGHRMARSGDIGDFGGMKHGEVHGPTDLARKINMRCRGLPLNWDHTGQKRIAGNPAADQVQKINLARGRKSPRNLHTHLAGYALVKFLIGRHPQTHDEIRATSRADRIDHGPCKPHTVLKRPAPFILTPVLVRRPKGIHQMPIGLQFDPIEPRLLHTLRGRGEIGNDALDIPSFHLLGESPMRRLTQCGWGHHRQPIALIPIRPPPQMGQLDHHFAIMLMTTFNQIAQRLHNLVAIGM